MNIDQSHIPILPLNVYANISDLEISKTRILFYHCLDTRYTDPYVSPAVLMFKTYMDFLHPDLARCIEWLVPLQNKISDEDLIDHVNRNGVDILCTSHYIWNHGLITDQLSRIRSKLDPALRIIAGGPSIDVNIDPAFFAKHTYIDYAVYGPGERALADILRHLILGDDLVAERTSNCAWPVRHSGQQIVAGYEFVKMLETSPFLHCRDLFTDMVREAKSRDAVPFLPYSLTRGCPYSCTFCDWNSGLSNKVSRRKNTYEQEIDLFYDLGMFRIFLSDANVGQYDEDVAMIAYFAEKNLNSPPDQQFHLGGSYSKLNKKNNLKIFKMLLAARLLRAGITLSVQDTNQMVLANIDRPDVGWDEHVAMADEIRREYPNAGIRVQLVYGLPGQTPASWRQTMVQVLEARMIPSIFINEPLPASPAMTDPEYQRRWQFEYIQSRTVSPFDDKTFMSMVIPKKSSSFDQADLIEMTVVSGFCQRLGQINAALPEHISVHDLSDILINKFLDSQIYTDLYNDLYSNWTVNQDFFSTVDFGGNPVQPHGLVNSSLQNINQICNMISNVLPDSRRKAFINHVTNPNFIHRIPLYYYDFD
jgi:radical SAM superfamily enzyme YgiQ (UPF0313 family)